MPIVLPARWITKPRSFSANLMVKAHHSEEAPREHLLGRHRHGRLVRRREDDHAHGTHHGRVATLVAGATGVVIAAAFCGMFLPRKPTTTIVSRTATASTAMTMNATRFPRPVLLPLTITRISGSLSMLAGHCIDCAEAMDRRRNSAKAGSHNAG